MNNNQEHMGKGVLFERIRRITGYLVGTMDKWNNAKKAEERDRVKHGIGEFTNSDRVKRTLNIEINPDETKKGE